MTKVSRALFKMSGKMDGKVHVQKKDGYIIRALPKTTGKKSVAFTRNKERTGFINNLASEINSLIPIYTDSLGRSTFYGRLRKAFRMEELDNHFLMLRQLKGMEINPDYPFAKHGEIKCAVKKLKNEIAVDLDVLRHTLFPVYDANCYYYEVTLFCWDKTKKTAMHSRQLSDWIFLAEALPSFEFIFPKPAKPTHWLLCVRVILGIDKRRVEAFVGEGMQVFDVGTFDKKDAELLKERQKLIDAEPQAVYIPPIEEVRVMAKKK
ncbi:MAG: hypothetical protein ABI402_16900 [Ferruginibacter sp.]